MVAMPSEDQNAVGFSGFGDDGNLFQPLSSRATPNDERSEGESRDPEDASSVDVDSGSSHQIWMRSAVGATQW
jgi:hypothetical protein